jgi:SAM-dependent methyltransferase
MGRAVWGADPEYFGPRHAHREARIRRALAHARPAPGPHLDCAAGVGSLAAALTSAGRTVVAADLSLRSLAVVRRRTAARGQAGAPLLVLADVNRLPFRDRTFASVTSAETLEHVPDDAGALTELARVLADGGPLVATVPADPGQWSDWDEWAGHLRRYTRKAFRGLLAGAGLEGAVTVWGWPVVRLYDGLFLGRVNRRRLRSPTGVEEDPALRAVGLLGRRRWLVRLVRAAFALDRPFDGAPWGVGLLVRARKPGASR